MGAFPYWLPPGFACARGVGGFSRDSITKTSLKAFSDKLNLLSDSARFGAGSARLKVKQLAPSVAPNDSVIFKSVVSLKRPYSSLRIAAVDAVSTARAAIVA